MRLEHKINLSGFFRTPMNFNQSAGNYDEPNHPYHKASIGKTFTAVVIAMLSEKEQLHFSDPVHRYLDQEIIKGIHVYNGVDYTNGITIHHLLNQTSGLADVFMDKNKGGSSGMGLMVNEPERFWNPLQTIEWT